MPGLTSDTKFLLHCNGVDESTTFTDSRLTSPHTVTANGDAQIDTAVKKWGSGSAKFDGSGDYLYVPDSTDWDIFGTDSDYHTLDLWFQSPDVSVTQRIWDQYPGSGDAFRLQIENSALTLIMPSDTLTQVGTLSNDTWHHVAIIVKLDEVGIYLDGTQIGYSNSWTTATIASVVNIGRQSFIGTLYFTGWMDEIRIQNDNYFEASPNVGLTDTITVPTEEYNNDEEISFSETITLLDLWDISAGPISTETITLSDAWWVNNVTPVDYISKMIYDGSFVYFVTDANPAQIISIDVSTPSNPVKAIYNITGQQNAVDFTLNDTNGYFYVACANGNVVKILKSNLTNQTIISTLESDSFVIGDSLDEFLKTFVSTNDSSGEIVLIDEQSLDTINTDIRWNLQNTETIFCRVNTISGELVNTDVRYAQETSSLVSTDARWIQFEYDEISQSPINYTDIQVKINGTDLAPLDDVNLKSISITHTKEDKSTASFQLHRKHDKINFDNQGNSSQITNNNAVQILINGNTEFSGTIQSLTADSQTETVFVVAEMDEPADRRSVILLPLSTIGQSLHSYDCLVDVISNEKPTLNTDVLITNENGLFWDGAEWVGTRNSGLSFVSVVAAQAYIDNHNVLSLFTSQDIWTVPYKANPEYFNGIQVNLGTEISQQNWRYNSLADVADDIEDGTFTPLQGWEYFWFASFENFITNTINTSYNYLGTTLGSLSTDTWRVTGASYHLQKREEDISTDLGWYYVGSEPYQIISTENGRLITKNRDEPKSDGLYRVKDESYDYEQYAKDVADLEYSKLKNINDTILPRTSASISVSLDAYYFYRLKLLTRINLENTTTANLYRNSNGFPVAIKSITVSTDNMTVTCQCDNSLSQEELEEIDKNFPDVNSDEYTQPAEDVLQFSKFDPNRWSFL